MKTPPDLVYKVYTKIVLSLKNQVQCMEKFVLNLNIKLKVNGVI